MIKLPNYTAENFDLREFVPESTYKLLGEGSLRLINNKLIIIAQELRNLLQVELKAKYKRAIPLTINNWHTGGQFKESGLRSLITSTGARFSQHKLGQAIDVRSNIPHYEIFNVIMKHEAFFMDLGVRRMEYLQATRGNGFGWVHIDLKETLSKKIVIFKP